MTDPYELERWAFRLPEGDRADAFEVVADAFEEAGAPTQAGTRRAWAATMRLPVRPVGPDLPVPLPAYPMVPNNLSGRRRATPKRGGSR